MGFLRCAGPRRVLQRSIRDSPSEWPGAECGLDFWTLDFPIPEQEQHFVEHRKARVAKNLSLCCLATKLVAVTSIAWLGLTRFTSTLGSSIPRVPLTPIMRTALWFQVASAAICATCAMILWVVCRVPHILQRVGARKLEIMGLFCMILVLCAIVFSDMHYVIKMMGRSPHDEWRKAGEECLVHSDGVTVLTILGITQAGNMMIPIRWKVLLPLNLVGLLSYITVTVVGSADPSFLFNLTFLVAILGITTLGKRMLEINERKAHCDFLGEKSLRCTAEFKLSRLEMERQSTLAADQTDQKSECTGWTEHVFGGTPNERSEMDSFIEKIAKVGRREHWLIASEELQLMRCHMLGKGGYGRVVRGVFHGAPVAVKIIADSTDPQALRKYLPALGNELRIMRQLRHPNIVGLHGAVLDNCGMALVVELVDGVSFQRYVLQPAMPRIVFRFSAIYGVSCGLSYMHSRQPCIVHGDVKGGNVMVELQGDTARSKVLDFGLSRILSGKPKPMGGTLAWMAPEVYKTPSRPPAPNSDVFSFGRLLYFALAGTMPFSNIPKQRLRRMLKTNTVPILSLPGRHDVEERLADLLDSCMRVNELQRPSIQKVQSALFNAAMDFDDLALCVTVVTPTTQLPNKVQTDEGRRMENVPDSASQNLSQQPPQFSVNLCNTVIASSRSATTADSDCHEQEQQRQRQRCCTCGLGLEPLSNRLFLPNKLLTEDKVMLASLSMTLQRWNYRLPRVSCCSWHASLVNLRHIVKKLEFVDCNDDFLDIAGVEQCAECGILLNGPGRCSCDLCGFGTESSLPSIPENSESSEMGKKVML